MKIVIEITDQEYKYIQDTHPNMRNYLEHKVLQGVPVSKFLEELKRKILMEVDDGADDKYLSYVDICNRINNSIDNYKVESEEYPIDHVEVKSYQPQTHKMTTGENIVWDQVPIVGVYNPIAMDDISL